MADKFVKIFNFGSADDYYPLPIVTSADNGKILRVVNGVWEAADVNITPGGGGGSEPTPDPEVPTPDVPTPDTPVVINFSIDGISYQATEGMTWAAWCDSEYNTDGWLYDTASVYNDTVKISTVTDPLTQTIIAENTYATKTLMTIINFTIDNTSYSAEESMTWAQWIDSDYNADDYSYSSEGMICPASGFYYVKDVNKDSEIQANTVYVLVGQTVNGVKIVSWADGTDEEIVAMVAAADAGEIDLAHYWNVGDTRGVNLTAMTGPSNNESYSAQTVEFVLMHAGGYELNKAVASGRTECNFIVGMKNCLYGSTGYMNSNASNAGSWDSSVRRAWCNDGFYKSIPSSIRSIFKQFKTITASEHNSTVNKTSIDYFTLPAVKEVVGGDTVTTAGSATNNSNLAEFNALFQYDYYKTATNRIKNGNTGGTGNWWTRSSEYNSSSMFLMILPSGTVSYMTANQYLPISPVGCI